MAGEGEGKEKGGYKLAKVGLEVYKSKEWRKTF